jgi:hypothetical protein
MLFWLISGSILHGKNTNLILKYLVVVKTSKNTKKFEKRKNVFVHSAKCLKANKIIVCFSYTKKKFDKTMFHHAFWL